MTDDFDADTLETLDLKSNQVIGPIAAARRKKEARTFTKKEWDRFNKIAESVPDDPITNTPYQFYNFHTQRYESYDYMTVQEVALKKFNVILSDLKTHKLGIFSKDNYFDLNEIEKSDADITKKEIGLKIGKSLYSMATKKNMQKGIGMIQKTTDMISQFGNAFGSGNKSNLSFDGPRKNTSFSSSKPNYSALTNKTKSPKHKRNSLSIWSDEPKHQIKPKRRRSRRKPVQAKQSNFLTGGKKVSFSSSKKRSFF